MDKETRTRNPRPIVGLCVRGTVGWRNDLNKPWAYIKWYSREYGRTIKITSFRGLRMYDEETAKRLLAQMRYEVDNRTFDIRKYLHSETNVVRFLDIWYTECSQNWTPGTQQLFKGYINSYISPFFERNHTPLQQIKLTVINKLRSFIRKKYVEGQIARVAMNESNADERSVKQISPQTEHKIIDCFHSCLKYAHRNELIDYMPPFPREREYGIMKKLHRYTTLEVQLDILSHIEPQHQPIFWWLALHMRRPAEAMMLQKQDYDPLKRCFYVRRGISGNKEVEYNKAQEECEVPCRKIFLEMMDKIEDHYQTSPFFFTCTESKHPQHRYTVDILTRISKKACRAVGVKLSLYQWTKHTTAQAFADAGYSAEQLMGMIGHKNVNSTKHYTKVHTELRRALLDGDVIPIGMRRIDDGD